MPFELMKWQACKVGSIRTQRWTVIVLRVYKCCVHVRAGVSMHVLHDDCGRISRATNGHTSCWLCSGLTPINLASDACRPYDIGVPVLPVAGFSA